MAYRIVAVDSARRERAFLNLPRRLYRDDPNHVQVFDREIKKAFDRKVNPYFRHGDATRWLALDESNHVVGRIAAFYDRDKDEAEEIRHGGCGYFECIDKLEVATLLFDTARDWLAERERRNCCPSPTTISSSPCRAESPRSPARTSR